MKVNQHPSHLGQGTHRQRRAFGLSCVLLVVAGCSASQHVEGSEGDGKVNQPTQDCEGDVCAANAPAIDWQASSPTYRASLRVVDALGRPLVDATVIVANRMSKTNAEGRVVVTPIEAAGQARVRVEKEGLTPAVTKTSAFRSGHSTQEVELVPVGQEKEFDADEPLHIADGDAKVDLAPRALASADGTRAKSGKAQLTYFAPDKTDEAAMPGSKAGIDEAGSPTALHEVLGVLHARFSDSAGQPLNLAAGQIARIDFPVGNKSARVGQRIPLWALDEDSAQWLKESSCQVANRKTGSTTQLVCSGTVSHFSYWALASEVDIYERGSLGCINTQTSIEKDACFTASVHAQTVYACDSKGEKCRVSGPARELLFPGATAEPSWCGVLETAQTYRVQLIYDVDASGCKDLEQPPVSGRRTMLTDAFSLTSFADRVGAELMLNFTLNGSRDCETLCQQLPFAIKLADLSSPVWIDHDNDGYFNTAASKVSFVPGIAGDCNDDDPNTHPGAAEVFCIAQDRNCDGQTNKAAKFYSDVSDASSWNAFCKECAEVAGSELGFRAEMAGNFYDEDCDGQIEDRDHDSSSAPEDCDDLDSAASPHGREVAGNFVDENCDGAALDADGDGWFASEHVVLAEALGLDPARFIDCDDFDPATHPKVLPANEAGALARFYYKRPDETRRRSTYCSLFSQSGQPNATYYRVLKDLSCDGRVTDADGDGFAAVGDYTLGAEFALDCDDLDPRVAPRSRDDTSCQANVELLNDSSCEVKPQLLPQGCPVLTLSGTVLSTSCEESKHDDGTGDGTGTGVGVCAFAGWWDGNPLSINPGTRWGPCDGDGPLPECPASSDCGGPLPYTVAFTKYIRKTYLQNAALMFKGMCFPVCAIL